MRVLFLSNYFPPNGKGGYELQCDEVAQELALRGHRVTILTSRVSGADASDLDGRVSVLRQLHLEVEYGLADTTFRLFRDRNRHEDEDVQRVRQVVAEFRPDVAVVWGMWNIHRSVPATAERLMAGRTVYYLCDYWPSLPSAYLQQWRAPSGRMLTQWPKRLVGRIVAAKLARDPLVQLRLERPVCVSHAVRDLLVDGGVPVPHAQVIYLGIEPSKFSRRNGTTDRTGGSLRLLYAGRLSPEKGVHTAIRAMAFLHQQSDQHVTLDIIGRGDERYARMLKNLVQKHHLNARVAFHGSMDRNEMPAVFSKHDVLIFPSEWEEPFARTVLEAMAAGVAVVGTTTGGTGEVLVEDETGLTFPPEDATHLAKQIERLLRDKMLARKLAVAARRRVDEEFTLKHMVDKLETVMRRL